jgi:hypothetical protein
VPHGVPIYVLRLGWRDATEGREVVEAALAHTIKDNAEAAYARSDLLEKRRPLDGGVGRAVRVAAGGGGGLARHAAKRPKGESC